MAIAVTDYAPTVSTTELSIPGAGTYSSGSPQTTTKHVQIDLDLALLGSSDSFQLRHYEKVTAAGTQRLYESWDFVGVQAKPGVRIPIGIVKHGWDVTLKKIAGTDRSIPCSIRDVS